MAYNRVSARRGQAVDLGATFFLGGQATDPHAIYRIEIFRGKVSDSNIVDAIDIPSGSGYPAPLTSPSAGKYNLAWAVPNDVVVPDVYFDVWYYFGTDPGTGALSDYEAQLLKQCNRFWVYPDNWYVDGGLDTIRFAFEPLDIKFRKPEKRPLEVGITPLPLYDYNYNLVAPLIPYLSPTITITTENYEPLVENAPCQIKLRQGSFRDNPWVISYLFDTTTVFIGTYRYRITLTLPDGTTRTSGDLYITVS